MLKSWTTRAETSIQPGEPKEAERAPKPPPSSCWLCKQERRPEQWRQQNRITLGSFGVVPKRLLTDASKQNLLCVAAASSPWSHIPCAQFGKLLHPATNGPISEAQTPLAPPCFGPIPRTSNYSFGSACLPESISCGAIRKVQLRKGLI